MTHLPDRASAAATAFCVLALALAAALPAAAQPQVPAAPAWYALPGVVPAGTTVVVRTRDGRSTKGRVSSLSDTAIVLAGGRVKSFPAADVVAIEGQNRRSVMRDAGTGAGVGLGIGLFLLIAAGPQDSPCRRRKSATTGGLTSTRPHSPSLSREPQSARSSERWFQAHPRCSTATLALLALLSHPSPGVVGAASRCAWGSETPRRAGPADDSVIVRGVRT